MADKNSRQNLLEITQQLKLQKASIKSTTTERLTKISNNIKSGKLKIIPKPISKTTPDHFICAELKKARGWVNYFEKQESFKPHPITKIKTKIKREGIDQPLDARIPDRNRRVDRTMENTRQQFTFGSLKDLEAPPAKGDMRGRLPKYNSYDTQRFRDMFEKLKVKEDDERKEEEEIRKQIEEQLSEISSKAPSRDSSPNSRSSHNSGLSIGFKRAMTFEQNFSARGYNQKFKPLQYHLSLESERKGLDDSGLWEKVLEYHSEMMAFPKYKMELIDYDNIRNSRRLFEKQGWLVGTIEPNLMHKKKKVGENVHCKFGFLRDIRLFSDQSTKLLVKEDKRFLYPKEYNLKLLQKDDYCKRKSFLQFKREIYRKDRKSQLVAPLDRWFRYEDKEDFKTSYKNLKELTGNWGVSLLKLETAKQEKDEFQKPRDDNANALVDRIFYHENEIDDFGPLKQEYHNKMELFRDQHRTKSLVGAKVKFKIAYSLKIKPEAIDIHVLELNQKPIDKEDVIDLL